MVFPRCVAAARCICAVVTLLATGFFAGCASIETALTPHRLDLERRNVLPIAVGPPVTLAEGEHANFLNVAGLVDSNGNAQLAGVDAQWRVHHMVVDPEGKSRSEIIEALPDKTNWALDIVEHPVGTIRIAAGAVELARSIAGGQWSRLDGNRCKRYLVHASRLYCAFVVGGEEAQTAPRTDVSGALVFIVPLVWWKTARPDKLALAERVGSTWVTRAIVDSANDWTAAQWRPTLAVDRQGVLHMAFNAWEGGEFWAIGGGAGGVGGVYSGPEHTLQYVRAPFPVAEAATGTRSEWQELQSERIALLSAMVWEPSSNREFAFGHFHCEGMPDCGIQHMLTGALRVAPGSGKAFVAVYAHAASSQEGGWAALPAGSDTFQWLTIRDFPIAGKYDFRASPLFDIDSGDGIHLLAYSHDKGMFGSAYGLVYVRRMPDGRIGAVAVHPHAQLQLRWTALATGNDGSVFVVWTSERRRLVGAWIREVAISGTR